MNQRRRKKKLPIRPTIIVFAVVVLLGLIFLIASGGKIYKSSRKNADEISQNTLALQELEAKTPTNYQEYRPPSEINLSDEQKKILDTPLDQFDDNEIRARFQGCVIMGDSITNAAWEFGFLDTDVIVAQIGARLMSSDELFDQAISLHPYVAFLFFGANGIADFGGDANAFVSAYNDAVLRLKESLPDVTIYLHAILPAQEGVYDGEEFAPRVEFNKALEEYCAKTEGVYYVNADFLLEQMPELYEPDGLHPVSTFYPRWLTYLADVAGLKAEN